jgi:hypothetical protein
MAKLMSEIWCFIGAHDTLVGLLGAIVGAIVTLLGTVGIEWWKNAREIKRIRLKASQDEARALAHYMNEAAVHCDEIAIALAKHEIPHSHGHAFNGLLEGFGDLFKPYLSTEVIKLKERMREVSDSATEYDTELWEAKNYDDLKKETKRRIKQFVIDAQRLSGDLRAAAELIRAAASRAQADHSTSLSRRKSLEF